MAGRTQYLPVRSCLASAPSATSSASRCARAHYGIAAPPLTELHVLPGEALHAICDLESDTDILYYP